MIRRQGGAALCEPVQQIVDIRVFVYREKVANFSDDSRPWREWFPFSEPFVDYRAAAVRFCGVAQKCGFSDSWFAKNKNRSAMPGQGPVEAFSDNVLCMFLANDHFLCPLASSQSYGPGWPRALSALPGVRAPAPPVGGDESRHGLVPMPSLGRI